MRENFDTHIEAMLHFQEVQNVTVHTYDKKKQCILNNDYHKAYQIIPKKNCFKIKQKTCYKIIQKPATKLYKNLLQNNTKTCNKIF